MEKCALVLLLKYSILTIPHDTGITDLLDPSVDIEDQSVWLHSTEIILIYTEIFFQFVFMCLFIVQHCPFATLEALHSLVKIAAVC